MFTGPLHESHFTSSNTGKINHILMFTGPLNERPLVILLLVIQNTGKINRKLMFTGLLNEKTLVILLPGALVAQ
jgi:hypothetical protein